MVLGLQQPIRINQNTLSSSLPLFYSKIFTTCAWGQVLKSRSILRNVDVWSHTQLSGWLHCLTFRLDSIERSQGFLRRVIRLMWSRKTVSMRLVGKVVSCNRRTVWVLAVRKRKVITGCSFAVTYSFKNNKHVTKLTTLCCCKLGKLCTWNTINCSIVEFNLLSLSQMEKLFQFSQFYQTKNGFLKLCRCANKKV